MKATIIDSIMGSNKTTFIINKLKQDLVKYPERNYIIVVPLLSEVDRFLEALPTFKTPKSYSKTKGDVLLSLLVEGENIVITHSLFNLLTDLHRECIFCLDYNLILDEVVTPVVPFFFNTRTDQDTFYKHFGSIGSDNYLKWDYKHNEEYDYQNGSVFYKEKVLCENGSIRCLNGSNRLVEEFNVESFRSFTSVTILTFRFNNSLLQSYFDIYNIEYEVGTLSDFNLIRYKPLDTDSLKSLQGLINICQDPKLNVIGHNKFSLSARWFDKMGLGKSKQLKELKNHTYNYFHNVVKGKSSANLWSSYVSQRDMLKASGYSKGFIAYNTKATNEYRDKENLAYLVNVFPNPIIVEYFRELGQVIDADEYALQVLLQWVWRSRIRLGKSINLYIPSKRMRDLLTEFLFGTR